MRQKYYLRNEGLLISLHDPYAWALAQVFAAGELSYHDGVSYLVVDGGAHTADAAHEPGTGADWEDVFEVMCTGSVGATGAQGIPGGALAWHGLYDAEHAYAANDGVISSEGRGCYALQSTTGHAPPSYPTLANAYWSVFAERGEDGTGVTNGDSHDHSGGDGAQIDHGALGGLSDDDHTQYIKHSLATSQYDFLVSSGAGAFVKQTLAQVQALLNTSYALLTELAAPATGDKMPIYDVSAGTYHWTAIKENIYAQFAVAAEQTIAHNTATVINFGTQVLDTSSAVTNPTTSWKFTAPRSDYYDVDCLVTFKASESWNLGTNAFVYLYINNGQSYQLGSVIAWAADSLSGWVAIRGGVPSIYLASGDYIQIKMLQLSGASKTIFNSAGNSWINVKSA